jgi:hypothetical protein
MRKDVHGMIPLLLIQKQRSLMIGISLLINEYKEND